MHGPRVLLCACWLAGMASAAWPATQTIAVPPASGSTAATQPTPSAASTTALTDDGGFDWRTARGVLFLVRSPQPGAPDSLVFGTIHVGTPAELGLDAALLRRAVQSRRVFINEVDGNAPWHRAYDRYRFLAPGQSLAMLIGGSRFVELARLLPGYKRGQLNRFKPWVAMTLLEEEIETPRPGPDAAGDNLDSVAERAARDHGLRLVHLETLEDQLAALDCTAPADYARVLQQRLADPQEIRADAARSLAFYRHGDLPGWLADLDVMRGLDAPARLAERHARTCLIEQRNARWIEELEPLLRAGDCFVAVGAIHLAGRNGLLVGLARRGFAVSAQAW